MMKAIQAEGVEWGEDYRQGARQAVAELLRGRMDQLIDEHLERMAELGQADRRNGCYTRWLLTELGMVELHRAAHPHLQRPQGARPGCRKRALEPSPLTSCDLGEDQRFRAFCPRALCARDVMGWEAAFSGVGPSGRTGRVAGIDRGAASPASDVLHATWCYHALCGLRRGTMVLREKRHPVPSAA